MPDGTIGEEATPSARKEMLSASAPMPIATDCVSNAIATMKAKHLGISTLNILLFCLDFLRIFSSSVFYIIKF
jgi:hypothetical protein